MRRPGFIDGACVALGLIALVAGGAGCDSASYAGPPAPVNVQQLYGQNCARCHGPDGRGDPEMKKTIPNIRDFSDPVFRAASPEQIEALIVTGRGQMPGFGNALSKPKVQHLAGYARRLGEDSARAQGLPAIEAAKPVAPPMPGY